MELDGASPVDGFCFQVSVWLASVSITTASRRKLLDKTPANIIIEHAGTISLQMTSYPSAKYSCAASLLHEDSFEKQECPFDLSPDQSAEQHRLGITD